MDLDLDLDFGIDEVGGDSTSWGSYDIMNTPEDCLGMIMTMIEASEYNASDNLMDLKMLLDDILEYAELGLQFSRDKGM